MAASLTRPDPSSPASVAEAGFTTSRRGFNQGEVRAFLTSVAAELGRLQERQRQLEAELHSARSAPPASLELDDETVASVLGEETLRVLHTARESASEIKIRAEETAARVLREANDEANRIRQETEVEVARRRYDASADAEAEVALAKQQGREMVNEARAYRERVLADLERRTTLARHQIEELVHGRDRLLQVFERARLVAVDVTSELHAIDGPDELVNLAPTTGPVPLMVPAVRDVDDAAGSPATAHDAAEPDAAEPDAAEPDAAELVDIVDAATHSDGDHDDRGDHDHPGDTAELADLTDELDGDAAAPAAGDADERGDDDDADGPGSDAGGDERSTGPAPAARDANVVSLFRGRATATDEEGDDAGDDATDDHNVHPADESDVGESDDDADPARADVGGIFARLRSETDSASDALPAAAADPAHGEVAGAVDEGGSHHDRAPDHDEAEPVADETPFSRRDEALVPLIVAAARKLKRVLADEQNGVLDTLRHDEPVTDLDEVLPGLDEHLAAYVTALGDELISAAAAGAGELGVNDTKTLRRKLTKNAALDATHDLVRADLLRPLRDRLAGAVSDGAGDNEDITKRVRAVYREWKTQHIDDQLDDVFRFAYGGGVAHSVEPGTPLHWSIDTGHSACPDCEDNSLAGSVAAGEPFPTGHTSAPAHPGCRCLTLPAGQ